MAGPSNIEWCEHTWNPIVGCSIVSPGCTNCYAMRMARRLEAMSIGSPLAGKSYGGLTKVVNGNPVWTGALRFVERALTIPLKRKKPTTYFVNSMGDLFHEDCPDEWIDRVFAVMALCPQHTFQVLTKRAERMRRYVAERHSRNEVELAAEAIRPGTGAMAPKHTFAWPLPNVWLGVSAERQQEWDERKEHLKNTPAAVHFASFEPLLGGIVEPRPMSDYLQWAIVGGESGPHARLMHPDWARSLQKQCEAAGVEYFFKQWGEYLPVGQSLPGCGKVLGATAVKPGRMKLHYAGTPKQAPRYAFAERGVEFASTTDDRLTFRVGKKAAGRLLDGREWNQMPETQP